MQVFGLWAAIIWSSTFTSKKKFFFNFDHRAMVEWNTAPNDSKKASNMTLIPILCPRELLIPFEISEQGECKRFFLHNLVASLTKFSTPYSIPIHIHRWVFFPSLIDEKCYILEHQSSFDNCSLAWPQIVWGREEKEKKNICHSREKTTFSPILITIQTQTTYCSTTQLTERANQDHTYGVIQRQNNH